MIMLYARKSKSKKTLFQVGTVTQIKHYLLLHIIYTSTTYKSI